MTAPKTSVKKKLPSNMSSAGYEKLAPSVSEKQLHQRMVSFRQQLSQDPEAARNFLASAGIITPKGRLRKIFGG